MTQFLRVEPAHTKHVLIVDGYPIVRVGMETLIGDFAGFDVAASASTREEALSILRARDIDVVITSLSIGPKEEGIDLVADIRKTWPEMPVLVVSGMPEEKFSIRAFQHGANGYVQKDATVQTIRTAMKSVSNGGAYFSQRVGSLVVTTLKRANETSRV